MKRKHESLDCGIRGTKHVLGENHSEGESLREGGEKRHFSEELFCTWALVATGHQLLCPGVNSS